VFRRSFHYVFIFQFQFWDEDDRTHLDNSNIEHHESHPTYIESVCTSYTDDIIGGNMFDENDFIQKTEQDELEEIDEFLDAIDDFISDDVCSEDVPDNDECNDNIKDEDLDSKYLYPGSSATVREFMLLLQSTTLLEMAFNSFLTFFLLHNYQMDINYAPVFITLKVTSKIFVIHL